MFLIEQGSSHYYYYYNELSVKIREVKVDTGRTKKPYWC
jgi:hypothetical protein